MSRASSAHRALLALAALAVAPGAAPPSPVAPPPFPVAPRVADGVGAGAAAGEPDVGLILHEAQRVQVVDVAAWSRFRFRRTWLREERDDAGAVILREELEFRVTPERGGFDELLVLRNGEPPTAQEIERHRREGRFTKHYLTMVRGDAQSGEGGYSLAHLLRMSSYRYAGRELYNGFPCHRLDFSPDEERPGGGLSGKFANAMAGSLWISVDGYHLAGAHSHTVRPISIYLGLSKVHDLDILMESTPNVDGYWLPKRIEVRSKVRILFRTLNRMNVYGYLDFAPVAAAATSAGTS
jgi:hypothetical protein